MATFRNTPGPSGDPLAEATELTKRLKLPYLRRALTDLIPTAKAQRWEPAEVVRVLLAEEAAGRDAANLRTRRKRAGFPAGKTFHDWDESASSVSRPTQDARACARLTCPVWVVAGSRSRGRSGLRLPARRAGWMPVAPFWQCRVIAVLRRTARFWGAVLVLVEGYVADQVESSLDAPVTADESSQVIRVSSGDWEGGQVVDQLDTGGFTLRAAPAADPDGLPGPEQLGAYILAQGKDFQASGIGPLVAAGAIAGVGAGVVPGQGCQAAGA